jgi:hypothetical protein
MRRAFESPTKMKFVIHILCLNEAQTRPCPCPCPCAGADLPQPISGTDVINERPQDRATSA